MPGTTESSSTPPAQPMYGQALLAQLQETRSALPTGTVLTLVLGSLRVRMMRSTITMVEL